MLLNIIAVTCADELREHAFRVIDAPPYNRLYIHCIVQPSEVSLQRSEILVNDDTAL
jgi:hypothetical protein